MPVVLSHSQCVDFGLYGNHNLGIATPAHGAREIETWHNVMQPGHETPVHRHESEEIVVVLRGRGEAVSFADSDATCGGRRDVAAFAAPCTLILEARRLHQLRNCGDEELVTIAAMRLGTRIVDPNGVELTLPWRA